MIGNRQQRGTTTWSKDPTKNNKFAYKEDLERLGEHHSQWYEDQYDPAESPILRMKLSTGTLV